MKPIWVGSIVAASAVAIAVPLLVPHSHAVSHSRRAHPDDRPHAPGTHRASPKELAVRDRVARAEAAKLAARRFNALASVPSTSWVNLGPTDAPQEFNYFTINGVDSGRPNNIVVDPRDPNIVYMAVSGGGVWKTFDFQSASPHWAPTMDLQSNLAVGALALDPDHPDTVFVGNGDFVDASGETILKSTDGGDTWAATGKLAGGSWVPQIAVESTLQSTSIAPGRGVGTSRIS